MLYINTPNGRFVYSHSFYLPTTILLVSPLTQASTQRYRYTNHPGQQSEIHY